MLLSVVSGNCHPAVLVVAVFLLGSLVLAALHRRRSPLHVGPDNEKKDSPDAWTPSDYVFPTPPPSPTDPLTTPPLRYRPFRPGPTYNITMGLSRLSPSTWLQLDHDFPRYHATKLHRLRTRPSCLQTLPAALPAAHELLSELHRFLPARYPTLFTATPTTLHSLATHEHFPIPSPDPLRTAALLLQDDLALLLPDATGTYRLLAGAILLPGFWRLQDKLGRTLDDVHTSGGVPGYERRLQRGVRSFFRRLAPAAGMERWNYFFQLDGELAWSASIGAEEGAEGSFGWGSARPLVGEDAEEDRIWFRSERQTLRRLPRTGAVVFTIRTYMIRVKEMCRERGVPGRLASAVRSWERDGVGGAVAGYKGLGNYGEVLLKMLDREHARQVEEGVIGGDEEEERRREQEGVVYPW